MGRFLWSYFRRYSGWLAVSLLATLVYAGSTVLLVSVFELILSDVLGADDSGLATRLLPGSSETPAEDSGIPEWLQLDLAAILDSVLETILGVLGAAADDLVWLLPVLFAVIFLARSAALFFNGYLFQVVGLGATNDLRNDLYERILYQSSRFYGEHPSGELVSRVGNDVAVMQNAVSNRLLDLFQQSVLLIGLVWYLLSANFRLAVICLVVVPAIVYPVVRFGKGMRRTSHRSQERLADLSNLVAEAVRGHRVVKAFGMEPFELARFRQATARHLRVRLRAQLLAHASSPVIESVAAVGAAGFLIWAGREVQSGRLTASSLLTFLVALIMLYDPIRKLNKVNLILQEALAAAHRIQMVMEIPNDVVDPADPVPLDGGEIRFEDVSFAYDRAAVLDRIDLTIRTGETVALAGPSGAGKSSLVNLLPRFYDPDQGRVTLGGIDLREVSLEDLRSRIGIVTQDTVLFNDTIRNNIAYGRSDLPMERIRAAARAAFAEEFIEAQENGWDTVIGEGGAKLSGGQRQRLAIARALLKDPPILILDEATSHLDAEAEALVQKALANLMQGRTSVVIAHRLSTIQKADRILVMEAGRIVEQGTHDELLARPEGLYRRLHDRQRDGWEADLP